jgi:hypothetical protein
MQNIVSIWSIRPSYDQDKISYVISDYLRQNKIEVEILYNTFPDEMIECIRKFMDAKSHNKEEEELILHLKKDFRLSLVKIKKKMNELRQCIISSNNIYNYCLRWPHVVGKYKERLDHIEVELNKIGQDFNMLQDQDRKIMKRIQEL